MFKGVKKYASSRFNLKKWIGLDQIKGSAKFIGEAYGDLSPKKEAERRKQMNKNLSFEEVMQLNRMTDADVQKVYVAQRNACLAFLIFAIFPLAYGIYLFTIGMYLGGLVSVLASALCLAYAFRYRVGMYQYKHRVVNVEPVKVLKHLFDF